MIRFLVTTRTIRSAQKPFQVDLSSSYAITDKKKVNLAAGVQKKEITNQTSAGRATPIVRWQGT